MVNQPKNQHDVPCTYLKKFAIHSSDLKKKKIVSILRIHHKKQIEEKSVDSNFFKNLNFYTIENENPFAIEEIFRDHIEPMYNDILEEISAEKNLSVKVRGKLVAWLWFSKFRNIHQRRILEQLIDFYQSNMMKYNKSNPKFEMPEEMLDKTQKILSKEMHIKSMFNQKLIDDFDKGISSKHWIVLKSSNDNKFITNDNPGFSVNIDMGKPNYNSINVQFATNANATNYYPLSPEYCLMISPFWEGTPLHLNFSNLKIRYIETNENHIDFINTTTYSLMRKYCVSNDSKFLKKYLKIDLLPQKSFSKLPIFPIGGIIVREGEEYLTKKNR